MSDKYVPVPIPISRYAEVIALLASPPAPPPVTPVSPVMPVHSRVVLSGHGVLADDGSNWSDQQLAELVGWVSPIMRSILRVLAQVPDEWVSIPMLAERCNVTPDEIRSTIRGFGRSFYSRCGRNRQWPFGWQKRRDDGRYWYHVSAPQSRVILRTLGEPEGSGA